MSESTAYGDVANTLLFENDRVRIWEMKIEPGVTGDLHRHDLDHILVQISGDRMAVKPDLATKGIYDEYLEADVIPGQYFYVERGGIERAYNCGEQTYHEILIELKDQSASSRSGLASGRDPGITISR